MIIDAPVRSTAATHLFCFVMNRSRSGIIVSYQQNTKPASRVRVFRDNKTLLRLLDESASIRYSTYQSESRGGLHVNDSDIQYYRSRIAEEEIAAQRATHPLAAKSHKRLAEEYASLLIASNSVPAPSATVR
jgi:hypothetical protein